MKNIYIPFFAILISCTSLSAQDLFIKKANLIDVSSGKIIEDQDIRIKDGKIAEIGKRLKRDSEQEIDAKDKFVIPGLVDAHIHLFQSGGLYTRPDVIDLTEIRPYVEERIWAYENAEDILNRYTSLGITSVIDVGGPVFHFDLRDSLNRKSNSSNVFLTGPLISSYLPEQLKVQNPPIIKVDSLHNAVGLVQAQHQLGADFIKIWYIAITPQRALDFYPIVEAACKEAKKLGLPIAVHATTLQTAKLALKAGATFLVHSVDDVVVDDEFLDMLKKSKAIYCPTLQVSKKYDDVLLDEYTFTDTDFSVANPVTVKSLMQVSTIEDNEDLDYFTERRTAIRELNVKKDSIQLANLRKLMSAGLPIALGTDAGNIGTLHASSFYSELDMYKEAGMSAFDLLKAMTIHPAVAINKHDEIGSINLNRRADMLMLDSNPLEDIEAVKNINTIIKGGKIIDQNTLINRSPENLVQQQINGYNAHSLEAFLEPYAEDVRIYQFPNELLFEGKEEFRKQYQFVNDLEDLYSQLNNRIIKGDTIIDYVVVTVDKDTPPVSAVAIFRIEGQKIQEVYFVN